MRCSVTILPAFLLASFVSASYDEIHPKEGGLILPGVAKRAILSPRGDHKHHKKHHKKHRKHKKKHGKKHGLDYIDPIGKADDTSAAASDGKSDTAAAGVLATEASESKKSGAAADPASASVEEASDPIKEASTSIKGSKGAF
jgi:hypothetical protein